MAHSSHDTGVCELAKELSAILFMMSLKVNVDIYVATSF